MNRSINIQNKHIIICTWSLVVLTEENKKCIDVFIFFFFFFTYVFKDENVN